MRFQIGDKVRRKRDKMWNFSYDTPFKIIGYCSDGREIMLEGLNDSSYNEDYFDLVENNNKKKVKINKHVVIKDTCNNFIGLYNSYEDAIKVSPSSKGETYSVYKLIKVATTEITTKVIKEKIK
jgi:hypothetical protein